MSNIFCITTEIGLADGNKIIHEEAFVYSADKGAVGNLTHNNSSTPANKLGTHDNNLISNNFTEANNYFSAYNNNFAVSYPDAQNNNLTTQKNKQYFLMFSSEKDFDKYYISLLVEGLRLEVDNASGKVIGLSGEVGLYERIKFANIVLPDFCDGEVYFNCIIKHRINLNFVYDFYNNVAYDDDKKICAIGKVGFGNLTVRVCSNLYITLNDDEIVCIFITL